MKRTDIDTRNSKAADILQLQEFLKHLHGRLGALSLSATGAVSGAHDIGLNGSAITIEDRGADQLVHEVRESQHQTYCSVPFRP